jgi:alpha-tubulin suppressor-like RCC1 family protein
MITTAIIKYPAPGTILFSDTLTIHYKLSSYTDAQVAGIKFILNGVEGTDSELTGTFTFSNVAAGEHTLTGYLISQTGKKLPNTDFDVQLTVLDYRLDVENKLTHVLKSTIPNFVKEDYPNFVIFLKAYYEWLYSSNNPFYAPLITETFKDIDQTPDYFVQFFRKQYLKDFPESLTVDKQTGTPLDLKTLIKNISDFYSAKGTEKSIKFLLKVLYDTYSDVYYPKHDIFKPSDSTWTQNTSIKFAFSTVNIHKIRGMRMYQERGETIFAKANIQDLQVYHANDGKQVAEVFFVNKEGTFDFTKPFKVNLEEEIAELTPLQVVASLTIVDGGLNYAVNDKITIVRTPTSTNTTELEENIAYAKVSAVDQYGTITNLEIVNFGITYSNNFVYSVLVESELGSTAEFTVGIDYVCNYAGFWSKKNSHTDTIKKLADNKRYQNLSYVVRTDRTLDRYKEVLKKLTHPAGIEMLGDVLITSTIGETSLANGEFGFVHTPLIGNYAAYRIFTSINIRDTIAGDTAGTPIDLYPIGFNPEESSENNFFFGEDNPSIFTASAIAAGGQFSIAIRDDGNTANVGPVIGWGQNNSGQRTIPSNLSQCTKIACGFEHTVAIQQNGIVRAWGANSIGQCTIPTDLGPCKEIAAGMYHTIALRTDGIVKGWGLNTFGQRTIPSSLGVCLQVKAGNSHTVALQELESFVAGVGNVVAWGYNTSGQTTIPTDLGNCTQIAAGGYHTIAIKTNGMVRAWGSNQYEQIAIPSITLGLCTIVSAGSNHAFALQTNQTAIGWGDRSYGQTTTHPELQNCVAISAGGLHTLFLQKNGTVLAVGATSYGQIYMPTDLGACTAIAAGYQHSVALQEGGKVRTWGRNTEGQITTPADLGRCIAIAAGSFHTAAIQEDGTVRAWGQNTYGQCTVPSNLGECIAISAGANHTVALLANGTVRAWGRNDFGQTTIPTDLGVCTAISAGYNHTVALLANDGTNDTDDNVRVWGSNSSGQRIVPVGLGNCQAISGGGDLTLAVRSDGIVFAWGKNTYGQRTIPVALEECIAIAGGDYHTVVIVQEDNSVRAWGRNDFGQCNIPVGLGPCLAIACGANHTLALRTDGTVVGWGLNTYGQLNVPTSYLLASTLPPFEMPAQDGTDIVPHLAINPISEFVDETIFNYLPAVSDIGSSNEYWVVYPHPNTIINKDTTDILGFVDITIKDFVKIKQEIQ